MKQVKALYDYKAADSSELSFRKGDVISVIHVDESGWWQGSVSSNPSVQGMFPSNYCEPFQSQTVAAADVQAPIPAGTAAKLSRQSLAQAGQSLRNTRRKVQDTSQNSNTRYRAWAGNMALGLGIAGIPVAAVGGYWLQVKEFNTATNAFCVYYSLGLSFFATILEYVYPGSASGEFAYSIRGVMYLLLCVPTFFSYATILLGILWLLPAACFLYSGTIKEKFAAYEGGYKTLLDIADNISDCFCPKEEREEDNAEGVGFGGLLEKRIRKLQASSKLGEVIFLIAFVIILVIQWVVNYEDTKKAIQGSGLSYWIPVAKGFGFVLNLVCAIILLPVSRTFIRYLSEKSNNRTTTANILRKIFFFLPLDKALEFHKLCAGIIYIAAIGHTASHFANLGLANELSWRVLNPWSYVSGGLICLCMVLMYGASMNSVKRGHFEIFWYSHHLFILFFALLLFHGRTGFGPNFWKYFLVPGALYIFERIYREYSAYRNVALVSVTNMNDIVMIIEFDRLSAFPGGFKEGQYVFINCPHISSGQWHPFTISSAPQSNTATLHIRIQGQGSWTRELLRYLVLLGPPNENYFRLTTMKADGTEQGRVLGPDGKQLLRIYGPLAAPTQHVTEYEADMIIGAGIGVTPVCSTVQSIVNHLWKFSSGMVYPSHAYFYWIVSYNDIDSFKWMCKTLEVICGTVEGYASRNELANKSFLFKIFVTSAPKDGAKKIEKGDLDKDRYCGMDLASSKDSKTRTVAQQASFTASELYNAMKNIGSNSNQFGYVVLSNGRPNWEKEFEYVKQRHQHQEVGVAFCGSANIGEDLKKCCENFSDPSSKTYFRLHKENF